MIIAKFLSIFKAEMNLYVILICQSKLNPKTLTSFSTQGTKIIEHISKFFIVQSLKKV